ncbi:unnamed protein product [Rotaria sordida]|uniref:Uncharacterized protein n=1 Tax=Rotaria sordida TaxID=392033 RepID=A0A815LD76_9BILA|nr:unnamed protein product [Rotaria sordida]CAF1405096.1 unnamed protein product [Rotaria sordida]
MLRWRHILLCLSIFYIKFSSVRPSILSTKFNITLITPDNKSLPTARPHKSVHVKHKLSNNEERWTIVGIEPLIQTHRKAIEYLTVHLCNTHIHLSISHDENLVCNDDQSMLIYEWTPYSSSSPFRISDGSGFDLTNFKSIVLTVIYRKEKQMHKEQSGVILYISIQSLRYQMATIVVGDQDRGTHFSCRSSNIPRLLYGIKKLNSNENNTWWRIYVIRVRQFRRKLIQLVCDSRILSNTNQSAIEILSPDIFLMKGDYLLIECENISQANCYFLIYYTYKSKLIKNDNICQKNDFFDLFKLLPSRDILNTNLSTMKTSSIHGSTIILLILILLLIIWISIIVGCIIMRRIRGLVNYRPEPTFPFSSQKYNSTNATRGGNDNYQQRTGDADHIIQMDVEHA